MRGKGERRESKIRMERGDEVRGEGEGRLWRLTRGKG